MSWLTKSVIIFLVLFMASISFAATLPTIDVTPTEIDVGHVVYISGHCGSDDCSIFQSFDGDPFISIITGLKKNKDYNKATILITDGNYIFQTCKKNGTNCSDDSNTVIVNPTYPIVVDVNDLNTAIQQIIPQLNDLNDSITDIDSQIIDLNNQITILQNQIADLNSQDANYANQLADIYSILADHNSRITELETNLADLNLDFQNQVTSLQNQINDLNSYIQYVDQNLTDQINDLRLQIIDVNTTLNTRIDDVNANLISEVARLDSLISALDSRLTTLENTVNAMNHGTIYLAFDRAQSNGWLRVKGEAPVGTTSVQIDVLNIDRDVIFGLTLTDNSINPTNNEYGRTYTNVNDWNSQIYQIRATFYDTNGNQIGQNVFAQFYALSVLADFQGFGFVENKTYEYVLVLPSTKPINFSFGALTTGQYDFNLSLSDGNTTTNQVLLSSNMNKYSGQNFNTKFVIPGKGMYAAKLIAYNQNNSETTYSDDFNIEIVDLYDSLLGEVAISSPVENDNNFSLQANTFYTNGDFSSISAVNTNSLASICVYKLADLVNTEYAVFTPYNTTDIDSNNICIKTVHISNVSEGLYTLTVKTPTRETESDSINVGYDTTVPAFPSLDSEAVLPSVGAYSGILHVDVNTWDTLSGVDTVLIQIIDKNTSVVVSSAYADYNTTTGFWNHDFNTVFLGIPDGNYNIKAIVTDVASNSDNRTVDPGVDNTKPVINSITFSASPIVRGGTVTVDVNVSDNFSGVKEVSAVIVDSNLNSITTLVLSKTSGNILSGVWSADFNTDTNWLGTYTIIVDANDYAIPSNSAITLSEDVNVLIGYDFNILTSVSGTQPIVFSLDGNFRDDLGNVPTIDGNVILITGSAARDLNVVFDENGIFTIVTNTLSVGNYTIDLNYNTTDYNYTKRITIVVNNPAPASGGGGRVSGGPLFVPTTDTNTIDTNTPVENNNNQNNNTPDTNTENNSNSNTGNEVTTPQTPSGPTGLFGLGDLGNAIPLGVVAVLLIGGIWYFIFRKK